MSMFGFLGLGSVASGAGGLAVGAGVTHLIHKYTTGKTLDSMKERLGGADNPTQDRFVKKVAILKTLAFRDGDFSDIEKVFIYRYILKCPELSADTKVALALELDEPPPTTISNILDKVRSLISFKDLFASEEEAIGFIWIMYNLANADNSFDKEEAIYIEKICKDCKIPSNLMPKEVLMLPASV